MLRNFPALLNTIEPARNYDFDTVALMTTVFERLCRCLAPAVRNEDQIRRKLACFIARRIEQERDLLRLAELAFDDLLGVNGAGSRAFSRQIASLPLPRGITLEKSRANLRSERISH